MLDALITTIPKIWLWVFAGMGVVLVIVSLFAFVSFIIVCFRAMCGVKAHTDSKRVPIERGGENDSETTTNTTEPTE